MEFGIVLAISAVTSVTKFREILFTGSVVFDKLADYIQVSTAASGARRLKVNGLPYRLDQCVMPPPEKPTGTKTRSSSKDDSDVLSTLSSQMESMFMELRGFREESKAMGKSIDSTHEKIDEVKNLINAQREDIDKCLNVIEDLRQENTYLQRELGRVKQELCEMQQYSRRNTVDIQGVPETKSEKVFDVVKKVAGVLRFELKPEMVDAVHRLSGGEGTSRPRGIILKFVRRGDCDELLRLAKVKRGFSASELGVNSENKIFVNPSLSKTNRELLYFAKCAAREGRVRFAWFSNGKVLVRRRDGQPAIHITSRQQLRDLCGGGHRDESPTPATQN